MTRSAVRSRYLLLLALLALASGCPSPPPPPDDSPSADAGGVTTDAGVVTDGGSEMDGGVGGCVIDSECGVGAACCDGACINVASDVANCGGCGIECGARVNASAACTAGVCQYACADGFFDCDGNAANGCESSVSCSGACSPACGVGQECHDGTCETTALFGFGGEIDGNANVTDEAFMFDTVTDAFTIFPQDASAPHPEPRSGHIGAYDAEAHALVTWGGQTQSGVPDDAVWILDLKSNPPKWATAKTNGSPGARMFACSAYDASHRFLYVFGGYDSSWNERTDLWTLDLGTMTWSKLEKDAASSAPASSVGDACAFDWRTGAFVVFGGFDSASGTTTNALAWFDTRSPANGWSQVNLGAAPLARTGATFFDGTSPIGLFGGYSKLNSGSSYPNDVTSLRTPGMLWLQDVPADQPGAPPGRSGHAAALVLGKRYVFGGTTYASDVKTELDARLWRFDPVAKSWTVRAQVGAEPWPQAKQRMILMGPR